MKMTARSTRRIDYAKFTAKKRPFFIRQAGCLDEARQE
jgi:hypothetical protein